MNNLSNISQWDIWLTDFTYDDDPSKSSSRPVIVLSVEPLFLLSVKVTKHAPRSTDPFDVPISKWVESGLKYPSTARISKTMGISISNFQYKLGVLHQDERMNILTAYFDYVNQCRESKEANETVVNE